MLNISPNYKAQDFAGTIMPMTEEKPKNIITLKTRFGVMEIDRERTIKMPQGMVGFSEFREFGLSIPNHPVLEGFMLLQCIDEPDLTFILKPYELSSGIISDEDLANAIKQLAIPPESLAIMLVTTLRHQQSGLTKTVNIRAPLFLDTVKQLGWQHILNSEDYNVRHAIN
ncbi:flagellar assembly protein FliW [Kiloniella laminariae]|uniref:flagellar assembly protein FliW n=1 Tax=Kiloniella laminariae TaxID=454162 RepID=UPI00037E10C3|nr:flagellar assembly protein FliW [Kiloniella laminariae]